jgi:hypothetical protein
VYPDLHRTYQQTIRCRVPGSGRSGASIASDEQFVQNAATVLFDATGTRRSFTSMREGAPKA